MSIDLSSVQDLCLYDKRLFSPYVKVEAMEGAVASGLGPEGGGMTGMGPELCRLLGTMSQPEGEGRHFLSLKGK